MLRKKVTHRLPRPESRFYICSLSPDVVVYKGQLTSDQVWTYFADLNVSFYYETVKNPKNSYKNPLKILKNPLTNYFFTEEILKSPSKRLEILKNPEKSFKIPKKLFVK